MLTSWRHWIGYAVAGALIVYLFFRRTVIGTVTAGDATITYSAASE